MPAVKNNTTIAVEIEDTEGAYKAPTSGESFIQTLADGTELTPNKELLERDVFNGSIGKTLPRTGTRTVSGAVPVEAKASSDEGDAPEFDALVQSAMGSRRQITEEVTSLTDHTTDTIYIDDADIEDFAVGDIVMVKQAGAFHVSPITAVDDSLGAANITLLVPMPSAPSDGVAIAKCTTYTVADEGHPSLSISKYIEGKVLEQATGCRVTNMSLENFATGQIPTFNFGFEGLDFDRSLTAQPHAEDYDDALPPIVLDARVYMDGTSIEVNEMSFSLENSLGFQTAVSAPNGRISGRAVERDITGTFNPYKQDDDISNFTKFKANTTFSLFAYAKLPTSTPGEFTGVVAVYMPHCLITELGEADQDGLLQENISFSASRGASGNEKEMYMSFI